MASVTSTGVWLHSSHLSCWSSGCERKTALALILSRSARVLQVTYEAVIAVSYPELDSKGRGCAFRHLPGDQQARVGAFLPIVWKASHSPVYASADLGLIVEWTSAKFTLTEMRGCIAQMDVLLSSVQVWQLIMCYWPKLRLVFSQVAEAEGFASCLTKSRRLRGSLCPSHSRIHSGTEILLSDVFSGDERADWRCNSTRMLATWSRNLRNSAKPSHFHLS